MYCNSTNRSSGWSHNGDSLADSTARLAQFLKQVMEGSDLRNCDKLYAEVLRVVQERDLAREGLKANKPCLPSSK
jgi:hypothetical protein